MAARNILHKNKLQDFIQWLDKTISSIDLVKVLGKFCRSEVNAKLNGMPYMLEAIQIQK